VNVGKVDLGLVFDNAGVVSRQTPEAPREMARHAQDPEYTPHNGATPLVIPARPTTASGALPENRTRKRCHGTFSYNSDTESIATSASDCEALLSDDESAPSRPLHPTDYIPDTLDVKNPPNPPITLLRHSSRQ